MFARLEEFRFARWVKSLNRWTQILFSLALVAALNYLAARHFLRWDLTADHRYTLSSETLSYLDQKVRQSLADTLYIVQILPDDQSDSSRITTENINRLAEQYVYDAKHRLPSGPIHLEYQKVDPLLQKEIYNNLLHMGMANTTRVLILGGNRFRDLNNADLYNKNSKKEDVFNGENAITSAILDVAQKDADEVYFTTGHGERNLDSTDPTYGLSQFKEFLRGRHFTLKPLDLTGANNKIPATAKLVVIVDAVSKFSPLEIERLRQYLSQSNGRLLIFLEPTDNPGLDPLLHEWGLRSPNNLVVEDDPNYTTPEKDIIIKPSSTTQQPHEIVRFLAMGSGAGGETGLYLRFGLTRPVVEDLTSSNDERRQVSELFYSSKTSGLYKLPLPVVVDSKKLGPPESRGSFSLAALAERRASDAVKLDGGRVLALGSTDFIRNDYFLNSSANAEFILKCFNYLTNHENLLNIQPHLPNQSSLGIHETAQFTGLAWRFTIVPAVVALFGLIVFWLRNRS